MVAAMGANQAEIGTLSLGEVHVRPVRGIEEQRRWDRLVARHHYLGFKGFYGRALRHVAVIGDTWLALVGWQAGAFKVAVRDAWLGWSSAQRYARLCLVANNARFLVLDRVPNLASRVLGLSLRRLSQDMQALHGHPILLCETFVDRSRFDGTCYRAANWRSLDSTRGYSRLPGGMPRWVPNGQPKEVCVFDLSGAVPERLSGESFEEGTQTLRTEPPPAAPLRSFWDFFDEVVDFRKPRGQRYGLACYLTIAVAARMAGYRGVSAFAEFACLLDDEQKEAVGAFRSPSRECWTVPTESTFRYIFSNLEPDALDEALRSWAHHVGDGGPVAMDGKDVRGASKQIEDQRLMTIAAVEHHCGIVLGQTQAPEKSNEITAVRNLSRQLDLSGRTITLDALHNQQETARILRDECNADYVMTAVKDNQPTMHDDLKTIDWSESDRRHETLEKGHGRIESRRCTVVDLGDPEWNGACDLYGRRQAIRIERHTVTLKTGDVSEETSYALTSLDPQKAGAERVLELVRGHWRIEAMHYVRDFTYDEDRCRVHTGHTPRNLACLSNIAIAIIRLDPRFDYVPQANRYFANREQEALDAILKPLAT